MGVPSIGSQTGGSYGIPKNNRSAVTNEGSQYVAEEHNRKVLGLIAVETAIGTTVSPAVGSHERRINDDETAIAALEAVRDNEPPVLIAAGTVSGTNEVGETLTFSPSTFFNADSRERQWQKNSGSGFVDIGTESGLTYTVVAIDAGTAVRCHEDGTNTNGTTPANSNAGVVKPHFNVAPSLVNDTSGSFPAVQGDVLSVDISGLLGEDSVAYQWLDTDGVAIPGETAATYTTDMGETGDGVSCEVTATNAGGSTPATTAEVAVSAGAAPDAPAPGDWELNGTDSVGTLEINILSLPADNGDPITDLERRVNGGAWVSLGTATTGAVNVSGLTSGSFDEDDLEIRAVNSIGASDPSDTKSANPPIAGILAQNPLLFVPASPDYLTLDGSNNVDVMADAVAPTDNTRWYEQTTAGDRPAFVATSSVPSGVSAVQGDGVTDYLENMTNTALLNSMSAGNSYTKYALFDHDQISTACLAGEGNQGDANGTIRTSIRPFDVNTVQVRHSGGDNIDDAGPMWLRYQFDQPALMISVATDDVAEISFPASDNLSSDTAVIGVRWANNTSFTEFSSEPLVAYVVFDRILSGVEQAAVQAHLAGLRG